MDKQEIHRNYEKEFLKIFNGLCYSRSGWQVWADVMCVIACSISNAADRTEPRFSDREKEYAACIERIGSVESPAKLMGIVVDALEDNPEQDFLGAMYMQLNLGDHWKGQFFTPYHVCKLMSDISIGVGVKDEVKKKGYISINDPTCGAGATLIAGVNTLRKFGINYQRHAIFIGQDLDRVVAMMCYIQLSLLGCAGYVVVANTITNPHCGSALKPIEKEGQEFWYMPMFATDIWRYRIAFNSIEQLIGNTKGEIRKKDRYTYFFDFKEGENDEREKCS